MTRHVSKPMRKPQAQPGRPHYVSPSEAALEQFAKLVCADLVKRGRSEFAGKEASWHLVQFLKLIAELTTTQLNRSDQKTTSVKDIA